MSILDRLRRRGGKPPASAPASRSAQDRPGSERTSGGVATKERTSEEGGPTDRRPPTSQEEAERLAAKVPGGHADKPQEIPKQGWIQIAKRGWQEAKTDNVPLLAAGVAFYGFLSIFPALIALVLVYGLVFDPAEVTRQIDALGAALPEAARQTLEQQLTGLASADDTGLGWGLVASVGLALWSASNGIGNLMVAVNIAYDEDEERGFIKRKAIALALTIGAILFVVIALALIAVLPAVMDYLGLQGIARFGVQVARYGLLVGAIVVALAIIYRVAPDRDAPKLRWVSVGAGVATVIWLLVSVGFTLYANFGGYGSSYGSLAGVVVLLMWLWLSAYAILLGAEINAETEQQTIKDTTKGPEEPIGKRGAVKADNVPA